MKNTVKLFCFWALFSFVSCSPKILHSGYYRFKTECLGTELDGSQTLKAWGLGKNRKDAVEQAKKNAIRDLIFDGIRNGKPDCDLKPLITEANAYHKYEDYFNTFFKDDGFYKNFVTNDDRAPVDRHAAGKNVACGVTVRVLRSDLKEQLKQDFILK